MDESPQVTLPQLSALEARVLGVLVEKELTVPDAYPLTLHSLVAGCNQKSSRDPVMNVNESQVKEALDDLRRRTLVIESSGGRAWRYAHNVPKALGLGSAQTAIITALWLRGPQTAGELRIAAERFYRFADLSSVEAYLEDMESRAPAKVVRLARQPGAREGRWTHLYSGTPAQEPMSPASETGTGGSDVQELALRLQALEDRVARLEGQLAALGPS